MLVLVANFFLYFCCFFIFCYRCKHKNISSILWIEYAIISFLGVYTLHVGIYEDVFGTKNEDSLTIVPYLLCFISYYIVINPFRKAKVYSLVYPSSNIVNKIILVWASVMVLFLILKIYEAGVSMAMGLGEAYDARHNVGDRVFDYSSIPILAKINTLGYIFKSSVTPFLMFVFVKNIRERKNMIFLVLCFAPDILAGIAGGSRGALFNAFMVMLFYYILFRRFIPIKILRRIKYIGVFFVFAIVFYSIVITIDRYQDASQTSSGILRYFGESYPNLGFYFWDKVRLHPMGLRFFPEIIRPELLTNWDSTNGMYLYWERITGVPVLIFKTLFGDLYIEYGVVGAFVVVLILCLLLSRVLRKGVAFYNISYVLFFYQIVVFGFAGLTQIGGFNNIIIMFMIGFNIFIKRFSKCKN